MRSLKSHWFYFVCLMLLLQVAACGGGSGSSDQLIQPPPQATAEPASWVRRWNTISVDASGYDHAADGAGEQLGPTKASRATAIVQIAIFEVLNAVEQRYRSYLEIPPAEGPVSAKAAVAQAARDSLVGLYPAQTARLDGFLAEDLGLIENEAERQAGIELGQQVAAAVLQSRSGDGSELSTDAQEAAYPFSDQPGRWRRDPLNPDQLPLGSVWSAVRTFVLASAEQFRAPPPPALSSTEYAEAYADVFRIGGDGIVTPTERTEEQTTIGIFWAYDGTPSLCAPPRLYNQLVHAVVDRYGPEDALELARLFALVNVAMADAAISIWEAKYFYDFWRPVTAIRESDPGTGPTGLGDGNELTPGDPTFTPLGSPASNLSGTDFTPPFPTYPSGHAGFGGALFEVLRRYYGTDQVAFSFVSDEFNGVTRDSDGNVRPRVERSFSSFSQAEEENGQSRVYLGIHFNFDKTSAIEQGRKVGSFVFENSFQPLDR